MRHRTTPPRHQRHILSRFNMTNRRTIPPASRRPAMMIRSPRRRSLHHLIVQTTNPAYRIDIATPTHLTTTTQPFTFSRNRPILLLLHPTPHQITLPASEHTGLPSLDPNQTKPRQCPPREHPYRRPRLNVEALEPLLGFQEPHVSPVSSGAEPSQSPSHSIRQERNERRPASNRPSLQRTNMHIICTRGYQHRKERLSERLNGPNR